jgi:hypothetical protein
MKLSTKELIDVISLLQQQQIGSNPIRYNLLRDLEIKFLEEYNKVRKNT